MMNQKNNSAAVQKLDLAFKASLLLLALSAPLSIAATQTAWAFAVLFWLIRLIFVRPRWRCEPIDLAVLAFVGLTLISSLFSYEQEVSLRKMVAVSLVSIVYLVSEYTTTRRMLHRLVAVLLAGCFVASVYALATLAVGKNLKIQRMAANSPLRAAGVEENDTILKAGVESVSSPANLMAAIAKHGANGKVPITVYRHEIILNYEVSLDSLPTNGGDVEWLGISEWSRGRDTRAAGFFGHYTTFAESLQLIASLALGLLISIGGGIFSRNRILLALALAAYLLALFLTITRASWLSFLISAAMIVLLAASRRTIIVCFALAIPLIVGGLFFLQQKRQVGFLDSKDGSTTWRMTVWREGLQLLASEPRHLAVGVGMDSIKKRHSEWHMFDDGRLPVGHMHSTPIAFAFERGIPTLIAWLAWMFLYLRMLWRKIREHKLPWPEHGILVGCFGGTIGFLTSGLVHYNWGDSEVVMIFYLLMGMSLAVCRTIGLSATGKFAST